MHTPEFIFMLTRNDSTVPDAQARGYQKCWLPA